MTTEKPTDPDLHDDELYLEPPVKPAPTPPRGGRVSSGLALILAAIALFATGYFWYVFVYERPELLQTDVPGAIARLDKATHELKESLGDTDEEMGQLRETHDTLKAALDKIQAELSRNRTEWIVSEAEQLMLAANRRLQLARDVNAALTALRAADRQIDLLSNPNLLPVRRQLAREIALLESLERADVAGISLRLGTIADGVERLPLVQELRALAAQAPATGDAPATGSVWNDVLSLVRVRRHDGVHKPLLPPEQQYFARENLRLMLYGAQHALLQGNVATYHQNLNTASRWLRDYFDPQAQAVANTQAELEKFRGAPLMAELPDITSSLELLRKITGRSRTP